MGEEEEEQRRREEEEEEQRQREFEEAQEQEQDMDDGDMQMQESDEEDQQRQGQDEEDLDEKSQPEVPSASSKEELKAQINKLQEQLAKALQAKQMKEVGGSKSGASPIVVYPPGKGKQANKGKGKDKSGRSQRGKAWAPA